MVAASLKRGVPGASHHQRPPIPRPDGRGLIEAREPCGPSHASSRRFRGRMVAASLKRLYSERGDTVLDRFRGRMVAASLKLDTLDPRRSVPARFRGRMVAASLKPAALLARPGAALGDSAAG